MDKNPAIPFWLKYMPFLLFVTAFLLYVNGIGNGYNMDDELVTRNHRFTSKGITSIPDIFSNPYYSDDMGYAYEYRPIVLTSFAIEHQFFGEKPAVSHFFNVLLYAMSVVILFLLFKKMFQAYSYWISVLAVLLFLFHPLHTEAVNSIKNRDEILSLLGGLLSWWFSIKFVEKSKWYYLPIITVCFLFGALAKMSLMPMVMLIPISLIVFQNASGKKILVISILLVGLSFLFSPIKNPMDYLPFYILAAVSPLLFSFIYVGEGAYFNEVYLKLKGETKRIFFDINQKPDSQQLSIIRLDNTALKYSELKSVKFLIQLSIFVLLSSMSFLYNYGLLASISFVYFGYLFYSTNTTQKNVLTFLFVLFYSSFCVYHYTPQYVDFLSVFVFFLFLFNKEFKNYLQLVSIIFLIAIGIYNQDFNIFTYPILYLIVLFKDAKRIFFYLHKSVILVLSIYTLFLMGTLLFFPKEIYNDLFLILSNIYILLVFIGKTRKYVIPSLLFILFPVLIHLYISPDLNDSIIKAQSVFSKESGASVADGFIQSTIYKSERPISFAEMPVNVESPLDVRIGSAVDVLGFYMQKMFLPFPMGYYYGYAFFTPKSITEFRLVLVLFIHLALSIFSLLFLKKYRILCYGILFYLFSIVLYSGFLYPVVGVAADRFTYIASIGFCIALAAGLYFLFHKHVPIPANNLPSKFLLVIVAVILLVYGGITINRNKDWDGALTLMSQDIQYLDESAQAHNLYALNLMRESTQNRKIPAAKRLEMQKLAITHFDRAVQIWPGFFNAAYDKGRASLMVNDIPSAIDGFEKAVNIGPEAGFIQPYLELAKLYLQTGKTLNYLLNAKKLLAFTATPDSYNMVARGFYMNGQSDSAKFYIRKGIYQFPNDMSLRKNLSEIFRLESKLDSAMIYNPN